MKIASACNVQCASSAQRIALVRTKGEHIFTFIYREPNSHSKSINEILFEYIYIQHAYFNVYTNEIARNIAYVHRYVSMFLQLVAVKECCRSCQRHCF